MNALFFGTSEAPLYGVYHPPRARTGKRTGVILCAPFGQEYMRSHRAFRQLALSLAKAGYHVFRFDYRGAGDSWGDGDAFTLAGGVEDTLLAIEELQETADVEDVALIGLRLGATVAVHAAQRAGSVRNLVLWDPILDGAAYARELMLAGVGHVISATDQPSAPGLHVMGFPVSQPFLSELQSASIPTSLPPRGKSLLLFADDQSLDSAAQSGMAATSDHIERIVEPIAGRWNEIDNWGSAMIPQNAIRAIVTWVEQKVR